MQGVRRAVAGSLSAVFYSCGLGHFPSVPSLWLLVCQRGLGGEDVMAKPRPGWGLSFLSHLSGCYVYAALRLLPGERGCVYTIAQSAAAADRPAEGPWCF